MGETFLVVGLSTVIGFCLCMCWIIYTLMNRVDRLEEVLRTAAPGLEKRLERDGSQVSFGDMGGWGDGADFEERVQSDPGGYKVSFGGVAAWHDAADYEEQEK